MRMLSRVAENLFWIGRFVERAENTARLLDTARRMEAVPGPEGNRNEWSSILASSGSDSTFPATATRTFRDDVVYHLAFSPENPSSIYSSLFMARDNARSTREALSTDCWRVLNGAWLEFKDLPGQPVTGGFLADLIDRTKQACMATVGALESTALRDQIYHFIRLGTYSERADSTARILDVKYFSLLPPDEDLEGGVDTYQWMTILDATSTRRVFRRLYGTDLRAMTVTELLIQNPECARSLAFAMAQQEKHLGLLEQRIGSTVPSTEQAATLRARVEAPSSEQVIIGGLHEFLTGFIRDNNALGLQIAEDFNFTSARPAPAPTQNQ